MWKKIVEKFERYPSQIAVAKEFLRLGISVKNGKRLGDICDIHVGLTTLADKVYICKALNENGCDTTSTP